MNILFITADMCDDSELFYPIYRLYEEGYSVTIASFKRGMVNAKYHFSTEATLAADEVDINCFDGLMLPGGMAPEKLRQDDKIVSIVREFAESGKPIAAICHGPQLLFSADVLRGVKCTCYPGLRDDLKNCGGIYLDEPVVMDKNIITSRRPGDLPFFMKKFIEALNS